MKELPLVEVSIIQRHNQSTVLLFYAIYLSLTLLFQLHYNLVNCRTSLDVSPPRFIPGGIHRAS